MMSVLPPSPPEALRRLGTVRSLPQVLRLLREIGSDAIGSDGLCLLLFEHGVLQRRGCSGIDPVQGAFLVEPDGPAARAIRERRITMLRGPDSQCLLVPLDIPDIKGALVAKRKGAWTDASRDATERLAAAVSHALSGASLVDALPHLLFSVAADGMVEPLGRLWEDYGLSPDEAVPGQARFLRLIHPDDRPAVLKRWLDAIRVPLPFEIEHRLLHRDGRYRWFRTRVVPTQSPAAGPNPHFVGSSTEIDTLVEARAEERRHREEIEQRLLAEISDRGRAEARLAKAERIEAVGQLTSGVAHDFNNLLTVIIGNIEFLEAATRSGHALDAGAQNRLAAMREAAERGGNLTRQLLAFARRQRLEPRPTDLNDVVAELRLLLPPAIGGGVEVETRLGDGVWLAFVDRAQIERMILNLTFNAHDAMDVGGAITIGTRNRPVDADEAEMLGVAPGDYVEISVADTGRGMSQEVMERAFEPFFTTKPPGKSSGLGLSQVYGFARQSGGSATLSSVVGEGTVAAILLPRADGAQHWRPAPAQHSEPAAFAIPPVPDGTEPVSPFPDAPTGRILLVDDDAAVREVTSTIIAEAGYEVIEASGGQEALSRLAEIGPIDLMVTDYAMPGMNGYELWKAALQARPDLKVLFVTGYADLTALAEVPQHRVLLKPFRGAALLEKVSGALN